LSLNSSSIAIEEAYSDFLFAGVGVHRGLKCKEEVVQFFSGFEIVDPAVKGL
jgi:hypothetical protein